jgi:hypothetical protein
MTSAIPEGTQLKYFNSTVNSVGLQNSFIGAILLVANNILQNSDNPQLIKMARDVAKNPDARTALAKQAIIYALSNGLITTSSSTLLDNKDGTFDDNTVTEATILAIVEGLAANSALLTTLGYED